MAASRMEGGAFSCRQVLLQPSAQSIPLEFGESNHWYLSKKKLKRVLHPNAVRTTLFASTPGVA
eukprot:scaffold124619_cov17-Tisochrysis_lutea.AAC.1